MEFAVDKLDNTFNNKKLNIKSINNISLDSPAGLN